MDIKIGPFGTFRLHPMFAFSDFEHWGRAHNAGFEACIRSCSSGDCVVDVGAHIGLVTLPMSRAVTWQGTVIAFEPAEPNLQLLRSHLSMNEIRNVEVVPRLVGATTLAAVDFYEMDEPTGMNALAVKKNPEAFRKVSRPQVSLDDYFRSTSLAPRVIKIDVEGAEIGVLRGAVETLAAHRPTIFLSVHPTEMGLLGNSPAELWPLLRQVGYECRSVDGEPAQEVAFGEYILTPRNGGSK